MKILDVKLSSLHIEVRDMYQIGVGSFGVYGHADAMARLYSEERSSADIRVQLTPQEQAEVLALFEKISKRLKGE